MVDWAGSDTQPEHVPDRVAGSGSVQTKSLQGLLILLHFLLQYYRWIYHWLRSIQSLHSVWMKDKISSQRVQSLADFPCSLTVCMSWFSCSVHNPSDRTCDTTPGLELVRVEYDTSVFWLVTLRLRWPRGIFRLPLFSMPLLRVLCLSCCSPEQKSLSDLLWPL